MQLASEQGRQFNEQGFLFFPALFSSDEVSILRTAAAQIMQQNGPHVVRGPDTNAVRVAYGGHLTDETFQRLGRHPRIIGLANKLDVENANPRRICGPPVGVSPRTGSRNRHGPPHFGSGHPIAGKVFAENIERKSTCAIG